ncbi:MAG TPA: hypothetical protein VLA52_06705 [Thermohalobaculum sp.]|nr:hypothetical protein [Thermohalobaculum sp.]
MALDLTPEAIVLHEREAGGAWRKFAAATLDDPELPIVIGLLRSEAERRHGRRGQVRLWLPPEQVLRYRARITGTTEDERLRSAFEFTASETVYRAKDIAIAVAPPAADGEAGTLTTILITYTTTWREARNYAERWGFVPGPVSTRHLAEDFEPGGPVFRLREELDAPPPPPARKRWPLATALAGLAIAAAAWIMWPPPTPGSPGAEPVELAAAVVPEAPDLPQVVQPGAPLPPAPPILALEGLPAAGEAPERVGPVPELSPPSAPFPLAAAPRPNPAPEPAPPDPDPVAIPAHPAEPAAVVASERPLPSPPGGRPWRLTARSAPPPPLPGPTLAPPPVVAQAPGHRTAGIPVPLPRPADYPIVITPKAQIAAAAAPLPKPRPARRARPAVAALPVLAKPAPPKIARGATQTGLPLDRTTFIGIIALNSGRKALLRLPDGSGRSVVIGDLVEGWRVSAIGAEAMRISRSGEDRTLLLVSR